MPTMSLETRIKQIEDALAAGETDDGRVPLLVFYDDRAGADRAAFVEWLEAKQAEVGDHYEITPVRWAFPGERGTPVAQAVMP